MAPGHRPHRAGIADALLAKGLKRGYAAPPDEQIRKGCPFLWQLLTQDLYKDGTIRVLPTIVIDVTDGGFAVKLQDHASNQQLYCEVETLADLAAGIERQLTSGLDDWKPYKSRKVQRPEKRKKPPSA